ncbi:MAG: universal stress protein [Ardenticatenaceae bacterium]|nr:universal stress protein [Anaerolineales bacterium]MCB8920568.1 universal stress protein [Ardenticatenaceae bacterium]MCB8990191.1 universal stress protein [Ardenticatenaceae bacterium]MCB9003018.1 universal stress protein [Ardenticatenaceae bacterium]
MFNHVLVPLDGSAFAEAALPYALSLATQYKASLTLLRIVSPPRWQSMMEAESPELYEKLCQRAIQDAESYLLYKQEALEAEGFNIHIRVERGEPAAQTILDLAEAEKNDVIVMSTHGRSGLQRWMFGSVAERIIHHAHIPVLLVRPQLEEQES